MTFLVYLVLLSFAAYVFQRSRRTPKRLLPPGPRKLPIIGNIFDLPTKFEWKTYAQWGKQYDSDIIHVNAVGVDIVILNSFKAAHDLLDKRSSIYSSRPVFTMVSELMGWRWLFSAMPYGEPWRERRSLFQQHFHPADTKVLREKQIKYTHQMLAQILETPDKIAELTRHAIGGISLSMAYGIQIRPRDDPFINLAEAIVASIAEATIPGSFLVDTIPIMKYIPEWFPGATFQRKAREWYKLQTRFRSEPFNVTVKEMSNSVAPPSFTSLCLDTLDDSSDAEHQKEVIMDTAPMIYGGGADTVSSATHSFILAMIAYPEVQAKAQEELDRVLGQQRLPDFGDENDLPYLQAIVLETLRWQPVTPVGIPHYLTEDDIYDGYHLSANTMVIANQWAMLHDENEYPNPSAFSPERFLKDGKVNPQIRHPAEIAFGFGRREVLLNYTLSTRLTRLACIRVCPGSHFAVSMIWYIAASILSTFEISKAVGEDGKPIEPALECVPGLICHPTPFQCILKPRFKGADKMIRGTLDPFNS